MVGCSSQANVDMQLVTDRYACMMHIVSPLARGGGIVWRLPAQLVRSAGDAIAADIFGG